VAPSARSRRLSRAPQLDETEQQALEWFEQHGGGAPWVRTVVLPAGDVRLELTPGEGWRTAGPGGSASGRLKESLVVAAGATAEPLWIDAVVAAVQQRAGVRAANAVVLVEKVTGVWFHATRAANRESIERHGLDWRQMGDVPGIAGSLSPERAGVFLCRRLHDAYWFADMPHDDTTDIWAAHLHGAWLEADAGGGVDIGWALCPGPIPRSDIELRHADIGSGTRYRARRDLEADTGT
jgi:hypothetical protein